MFTCWAASKKSDDYLTVDEEGSAALGAREASPWSPPTTTAEFFAPLTAWHTRWTRNPWAVGRSNTQTRLGFDLKEILETVVERQASDRQVNKGLQDMAHMEGEAAISLSPQDLLNSGCTIEEMASALYTLLGRHHLPNFLPHVRLDRDGGLDRLEKIWYNQRYFWCILTFLSAVCNLVLLVTMNYSVFRSMWMHYVKPFADHARHEESLDSLESLLDVSNVTHLEQEKVMAEIENHLFDQIQDQETRIRFMWVASTIAMFEAVGVVVLLFVGLNMLRKFAFSSASSEFTAFKSLEKFFRRGVPFIATFSALKLARSVHPSLLYTNYVDTVKEASCCKYRCVSSQAGIFLVTLAFLISRILCGTVALMAFGAKVVVVASKLTNPYYQSFRSWAEALALLNCCIGTVILEQQLQDRIFLFMFAGGDAEYQDDERCLRDVYRARLAKQIWTLYWQKGKRFQAIVFLATLDHYDLQALVMEDSAVEILEAAYGAQASADTNMTPTNNSMAAQESVVSRAKSS